MRHLIILCVLLPGLAFGAGTVDELPAAAFAKLPEIKNAAFSPDGTRLVALRAFNETYHVVLFDLVNNSSRLLLAADPGEFPYDWCQFANNERVVCRTRSYGQSLDIVDLKSVAYKAGDGTSIPAYLGLPGPAESGPYPTVVLPHGGPLGRDTGEFDPWAQLFLARGYAVLKPAFRGSAGYGDAFMASGFNEWGLAMQDDVIAGLDWMIAEGYADPDKVCIAGGSYGGYVALVAAFKTPEKFRCAVSFAGVTDLDKLEERRRAMVFGRLATPRIQSGELRTANSPLAQVDKIGIPILLVHGDLDRNVMLEHATEFAEALEKNGKAYRYIEQAGGDHHLSRQSHRTEFFEAMDEFLATHLDTGVSRSRPHASDE